MRRNVSVWMIAVAVLLVAAVALGSVAYAKKPVLRGCPWKDLNCLDVWDPVTCNGVVYSNSCYALRACATNCEPGYPSW